MNSVDLFIKEDRWNLLPEELHPFLTEVCEKILQDHSIKPDQVDLSLTYTNDSDIQTLNAQFRNKDAPTDVLSFQQFDDLKSIQNAIKHHPVSLGDIVISYETSLKDAETQQKTAKDHVVHLFVHGLLHLLGYDHIQEEEAKIMESYEIKFLASYNISDPYQIGSK